VLGIVEFWRNIRHSEAATVVVLVAVLVPCPRLAISQFLLALPFVIKQGGCEDRFSKNSLTLYRLASLLLSDTFHNSTSTLIWVVEDFDSSVSRASENLIKLGMPDYSYHRVSRLGNTADTVTSYSAEPNNLGHGITLPDGGTCQYDFFVGRQGDSCTGVHIKETILIVPVE